MIQESPLDVEIKKIKFLARDLNTPNLCYATKIMLLEAIKESAEYGLDFIRNLTKGE